jgi:hypothetical protein
MIMKKDFNVLLGRVLVSPKTMAAFPKALNKGKDKCLALLILYLL